jgi:hypothetical protein
MYLIERSFCPIAHFMRNKSGNSCTRSKFHGGTGVEENQVRFHSMRHRNSVKCNYEEVNICTISYISHLK